VSLKVALYRVRWPQIRNLPVPPRPTFGHDFAANQYVFLVVHDLWQCFFYVGRMDDVNCEVLEFDADRLGVRQSNKTKA